MKYSVTVLDEFLTGVCCLVPRRAPADRYLSIGQLVRFGLREGLAIEDIARAVHHLGQLFLGNPDDPRVIPNDPVARHDALPAAEDRRADLAEALRLPRGRRAQPRQAGKPIPRIASTSRMAPSITTARIPRTFALSLANSPHTAGPRPPASMTMISPGFAASIASTGFAQSPG